MCKARRYRRLAQQMTSDQGMALGCALFVAGAAKAYSGPMLMFLALVVLFIAWAMKRDGQ